MDICIFKKFSRHTGWKSRGPRRSLTASSRYYNWNTEIVRIWRCIRLVSVRPRKRVSCLSYGWLSLSKRLNRTYSQTLSERTLTPILCFASCSSCFPLALVSRPCCVSLAAIRRDFNAFEPGRSKAFTDSTRWERIGDTLLQSGLLVSD